MTPQDQSTPNQPWLIQDEQPWIPGPGYDPPAGGHMLLSPNGLGHLTFHDGQWYRVRENQPAQPISAGDAMALRPLDAGLVLKLSHVWMLANSRLDRAMGLSDELADGCRDLLVKVFTLAGAM